MKDKYIDLIEQTFTFPQEDFRMENNTLFFNDIDLMKLVKENDTPLRVTHLPKISQQINKAKSLFENAFKKHNYKANYHYAYCTKASHFSFVMEEALKNGIHIETSSSFDIDLAERLFYRGLLNKDTFIICNGFKTDDYKEKIIKLVNAGNNVIPILDNKYEIEYYEENVTTVCNVGIRIAADEEPNFEFYTSRLGIRPKEIYDFYKNRLEENPNFRLKMLHFFINKGIRDNTYYWSELNKAIKLYCELKEECPDLEYINIGGGLPIKNSLNFEYDFQYMIDEIVLQIKTACKEAKVPVPHIFTEFGSFTVGESGFIIFEVLEEKKQNDQEIWYMIDGSIMTTMPDIWGISQRFIMLPINKWNIEYHRVNIGGLTCDIQDYYNAESHINQVYLPKLRGKEPLYVGFFNIGAYQESLSGYGGIKHCMIPSPRHILVDRDKKGNTKSRMFSEKQNAESMLNILGY